MRLCQVNPPTAQRSGPTIALTPDLSSQLPPYAILSHTWSVVAGQEITFDDLASADGGIGTLDLGERACTRSGWNKLAFCVKQALQGGMGLRHIWIDTCCINRADLVELSEAITSMWRWYQGAEVCWVYLEDVSIEDGGDWEGQFRAARWWTRGWTLQELLAPGQVVFFSREGRRLGDKRELEEVIHHVTGIPKEALRGEDLASFSVDERLRWTNGRQTKKVEDRAYCLLGIFDVSMSLRYGEGDKALARLEAKVRGSQKGSQEMPMNSQQSNVSERAEDSGFLRWLAPSRPEAIHAKVSASRHPGTGVAFTQNLLRDWLGSDTSQGSTVWITGKTGTGKTTLFSHIVDETRTFSASSCIDQSMDGSMSSGAPFAYHYCAFSDPDSQQTINILGSFAAQLSAWQPSILDDLRHIYNRDASRTGDKSLQISELEIALVKHMAGFNSFVLLLDALNESRDFSFTLTCINSLLKQLPNGMLLLTSTRSAATAGWQRRPYTVEMQMDPNDDIKTVIESHLAANGPLGHLSAESRDTIRRTLSENADQTFRWVALTIDNLRRQRTGKAVIKALSQTPSDLNNTYAAMLRAIPQMDRPIAREALRWLSFALRPLSLLELSEAAILESDDTTLDQDSRLKEPEVLLEICHGFISHESSMIGKGEVKLAHSSVKDYLLSDHVRDASQGDPYFAFNAEEGNEILMQKCLTYLMFDDFTPGVATSATQVEWRFDTFPLLDYAAYYWGLHASSSSTSSTAGSAWTTLAHQFFATRSLKRAGNYGAWVSCLIPEAHPSLAMKTQPLYYAASFGILPLVNALLAEAKTSPSTVNIEAPGGRHRSTALQVATFRGRKAVSEALFAAGADFWSRDRGSGAPAWFWVYANDWGEMLGQMLDKRPEIRDYPMWNQAADLKAMKNTRRVVVRPGGILDAELSIHSRD